MPPASPTIKYQMHDHVAWIALNRPEALNALNFELRNALGEAFIEAGNDDTVWVIILTSEGGRAFSTGADLKEMAQHAASGTSGPPGWNPAGLSGVNEIRACLKPVIAAIDGYCVAGGMHYAAYCDIRIATQKSRFGVSEARRGRADVRNIDTLAQIVPKGEVMWMMLTGSHMTAQRAYDVGLIQALVPDRDALFAEAKRVANEIKLCAPLAVQAVKHFVKVWSELDVAPEQARSLSADWLERVAKSEDRLEGLRAFAEKRLPHWKLH